MSIFLLIPFFSKIEVTQDMSGQSSFASSTATAIYDFIIEKAHIPDTLLSCVLIVILSTAIVQSLSIAYWYLSSRMISKYIVMWRKDITDALVKAEWKFFTKKKSGYFINTLTSETNRIDGVIQSLFELTTSFIYVLIFLVMSFASSPLITLSFMAAFGLMYLLSLPIKRKSEELGRSWSKHTEAFQSDAIDFLLGIKHIKATASHESATISLYNTFDNIRQVSSSSVFTKSLSRSLQDILSITALIVTCAAGYTFFNVDAASIFIVSILLFRTLPYLGTIQQYIQHLAFYIPGFAAAYELLYEARANQDDIASGPMEHVARPVGLSIHNLSVSLQNTPVLKGVSLEIPPGFTVALVGESGAGKSTLVDTILGLLRPDKGEILVNDHALGTYSMSAWRKTIGFVSQDTFLFHATVRENIAWSNPGCSDEQIREAARKAHAHSFIEQMERGYDTVVGDRGIRLSGGQRQRLGLARALLGEKGLLLLDEPTSALDSESEDMVMNALTTAANQPTKIIVAHRLSTIRNADIIFVLHQGSIVESGSPFELINRKGAFWNMWTQQHVSRPEE
ncbi:MAG: ABC transporter ATP-binding protein [Pseudomonadota bacterium]